MSKTKTENRLVKILTYILILFLCIGLLGGIVYILKRSVGMYVEYNETVITSSNDGITVDYSETETAVFTIGNYSDWGVYSVTDCKVKVINNVSAGSSYDFEFTVDGQLELYSNITDFSSLFAVSGDTITVNDDGTFELAFRYPTMLMVLQAYYSETVNMDSDLLLSSYPYFAIQVTSPDDKTVITIPFVYSSDFIPVYQLELSDTNIKF